MKTIEQSTKVNQEKAAPPGATRADRRILLTAALRELLFRCHRHKPIYASELAELVNLGDSDLLQSTRRVLHEVAKAKEMKAKTLPKTESKPEYSEAAEPQADTPVWR